MLPQATADLGARHGVALGIANDARKVLLRSALLVEALPQRAVVGEAIEARAHEAHLMQRERVEEAQHMEQQLLGQTLEARVAWFLMLVVPAAGVLELQRQGRGAHRRRRRGGAHLFAFF